MSKRICAACGGPLPPQKTGRPRKWCSERCRRDQYAGECIDCGAPTDGHDGPGKARERCAKCRVEYEKTIEHAAIVSARTLGRVRWSDEQILDAIRSTAKNGIASKDAYGIARAANPAAFPSAQIIIQRFGRWALAVEAAGLSVRNPDRAHPYRSRTPDADLLSAIRECASELGRRPTYSEYDAWAEFRFVPSAQTIRSRFGGYFAACERAFERKAAA